MPSIGVETFATIKVHGNSLRSCLDFNFNAHSPVTSIFLPSAALSRTWVESKMGFRLNATSFGIRDSDAPVSIRKFSVLSFTENAALKEEALAIAALVVYLSSFFVGKELGNFGEIV